MKGRVLLVNPWIYDFAAYCEWSEPLGLLSIAAVLQESGYRVNLIDCLDRHHPRLPTRPREDAYGCGTFPKTIIQKPPVLSHVPRRYGRYGLPVELFEEELHSQPHPDVIMVTSGMTYWYPGPFEAIKRAQACFPDVPVVLGGTYATLCYAHARDNSGADYVIRGEGELQALQLVDNLTGSTSNYTRFASGLGSLPRPLHELRRNQAYVAIETSRGCPLHCTYCASSLLHPQGFRRKDPRRVADETEYCHRQLGMRDFAFYDDALLVDADKHVHVILDAILERRLNCRFHTPNGLHVDRIDEGLATKMHDAGFKTVRLGLETSDGVEQVRTGAKMTNQGFQQAVRNLQMAGFESSEITAYVLMGLPGQPLKQVLDSVAFVHECGIQAQVALFSLIPGTVEWERAVQQWGFDSQADPLFHNNSIYPFPWNPTSFADFEEVKARALAGNRALITQTQFFRPPEFKDDSAFGLGCFLVEYQRSSCTSFTSTVPIER
jgi:hypothetical protein